MEIYRQDIQTHLNLPSTVTQKSRLKTYPCLWSYIRLKCFKDILVTPHPLHVTEKILFLSQPTKSVIHNLTTYCCILLSAAYAFSVFSSTDSLVLKLSHQTRSLTSSFKYKSCHCTHAHNEIIPKAFIISLSLAWEIQGKLECLFCFCCNISQKIIMVKSRVFEEVDLDLCPHS